MIVEGAGGLLVPINNKNFVILDAAMNDLLRPALYGSAHNIIPSIKKTKNIPNKSLGICKNQEIHLKKKL